MNAQTTTCEHCHSGCSYCGGERQPFGQLGNRLHYRCRNCGLQTSEEFIEDDFDEDYYDFPDEADFDNDYESPLDGSKDVDGNVDDDADNDHNNTDGDLDEDGRHNR
jgi:hypothetical protein